MLFFMFYLQLYMYIYTYILQNIRKCSILIIIKLKSISLIRLIKRSWFQFSSITQSYPTLCDSMDYSMPSLPVHHQLPEFTQTHVHWVSDHIQPSLPLSAPSPPILNLSQYQGLFKWVTSSHQVAKYGSFSLKISPSNE